jgi:hypothetical protein
MAELLRPALPGGTQSANGIEITNRAGTNSAVSPAGTGYKTASTDVWLCGAVAGFAWLLYFNFGRAISYGGDEFALIRPALTGSLLELLHAHLRPLEYFVVRLSFAAHFPYWLLVSLCSYIATAVLTLRFIDLFRGARIPPFWKILLCATSPLAAQAYFRVDTVAQALANLFTVLLTIYLVECLRATEPAEIRRLSRRVLATAMLCLVSKETTYGMVLGGSAILWLRHRDKVLPLLIGPVLLLLAGAAYSYLGAQQFSEPTQYGLKVNPLYWLFTLVFSVIVALFPAPTSVILTGAARSVPAMLGLCVVGVLLAFAGLALYLPRRIHLPVKPGSMRRLGRGDFTDQELLFLLLLCSLVPAMFVKAAELYATQALPYLKALLALALPLNMRLVDRLFWSAVSVMWVLATCINLMFYSVVMGAHPSVETSRPAIERRLWAEVERAEKHRIHGYSIYAYSAANIPQRIGACYVDPREPRVCLPKNIASGVPTVRGNLLP